MIPILMLHGALGASAQLNPLKSLLAESMQVHTLDFSGHGGLPFPQHFRIPDFAQEVLDFLESRNLEKVDIFGYSMGGYVALYLARHFPEQVGRVFTLGTKFVWDLESTEREVNYLNPDAIKAEVPDFAEILERRHAPQSWEKVLQMTAEMMKDLSHNPALAAEDFPMIENRTILAIGDRDKTAGLEDTVATYRLLQDGRLFVLPNTPHPFERVSVATLAREIRMFFRR